MSFSFRDLAYVGAAGGGFSPADIADLHFWFKSDAGTTLSGSPAVDGGNVDTWGNQVPGVVDFTQATGADQPTWHANAVNGLPTLRFNGSSHSLTAPHSADTDIVSGVTWFFVFNLDNLTPFHMLLTKSIFGNNCNYEARIEATSGLIHERVGNLPITSLGGVAAGAWTHISMRRETWDGVPPKMIDFFINGLLDRNHVISSFSGPNTEAAFIGRRSDGNFLDGDLAEIVFFTRYLEDDEMSSMHTYLSERYNI